MKKKVSSRQQVPPHQVEPLIFEDFNYDISQTTLRKTLINTLIKGHKRKNNKINFLPRLFDQMDLNCLLGYSVLLMRIMSSPCLLFFLICFFFILFELFILYLISFTINEIFHLLDISVINLHFCYIIIVLRVKYVLSPPKYFILHFLSFKIFPSKNGLPKYFIYTFSLSCN